MVGYSVALPGPDSGSRRAVWFGGGRLARDLTLPSLRAGWQQSAGEQADAVKEWSPWTSSRPRTRDERRAELEHRAVQLASVRQRRSTACDASCAASTDDPAGTARVARDARRHPRRLVGRAGGRRTRTAGARLPSARAICRAVAPIAACRQRAASRAARRSRSSCSRARGRTAPRAGFSLARQLSSARARPGAAASATRRG